MPNRTISTTSTQDGCCCGKPSSAVATAFAWISAPDIALPVDVGMDVLQGDRRRADDDDLVLERPRRELAVVHVENENGLDRLGGPW